MDEDEIAEISAAELVNNLKKLDSQMKVLSTMRDQVDRRLESIARGIENINLVSSQRDTKIADIESRIRRTEERAKELEIRETESSISKMNMEMVMNRLKVMEKEVEDARKAAQEVKALDKSLSVQIETLERIFDEIKSIQNLQNIVSEIKNGTNEIRNLRNEITKNYGNVETLSKNAMKGYKDISAFKDKINKLELKDKAIVKFLEDVVKESKKFAYYEDLQQFKSDLNVRFGDLAARMRMRPVRIMKARKGIVRRKRLPRVVKRKAKVRPQQKRIIKKIRRKSTKAVSREKLEIPEVAK